MIVIIGAGGETSRRIVQYARDQGIKVRLAARDPAKMRAALGDLAEGFESRRADAENGASVEAILEPREFLQPKPW